MTVPGNLSRYLIQKNSAKITFEFFVVELVKYEDDIDRHRLGDNQKLVFYFLKGIRKCEVEFSS